MIKQVHSNSLADCLGQDDSKNSVMSKPVLSYEVQNLISKIPNRVGPVEFKRCPVQEQKVLEVCHQ